MSSISSFAKDPVLVIYCNGILTSNEAGERTCQAIREIVKVPVSLHYNGTTNVAKVTEVLTAGVAGLILGQIDHPVTNNLGKFLSDYSKNQIQNHPDDKMQCAIELAEKVKNHLLGHPKGRVVLVLHSQGAHIGNEALKKLEEYRKKIRVIAIGGLDVIHPSSGKHEVNIQSEVDFIDTVRTISQVMQTNPFQNIPIEKIKIEGNPIEAHHVKKYLQHERVQHFLKKFTKIPKEMSSIDLGDLDEAENSNSNDDEKANSLQLLNNNISAD